MRVRGCPRGGDPPGWIRDPGPATGGPTVLDDRDQARLRSSYRTLRVTYAGMLSSLGVYWLVVMLTRKVGAIPSGRGAYSEADWLRYPLYAVGVGLVGLVLGVRARLLRPAMVRERAAGNDAQAYLNAIFAAHVVVFALAEIPAILGLALYFVGGYLRDFFAMAALALCAFGVVFPREEQGTAILRALLPAVSPLRRATENP